MKSKDYRITLMALALLCVVLKAHPGGASMSYIITDLGPGIANDINNLGQVVGRKGYTGFFWSSTTGRQELGPNSIAYSINDTGQVVGHSFGNAPGFLWDSSTGQKQSIPMFPNAINNSGQVAGWDEGFGPGGARVVIWDSINGVQAIAGGINGYALDINDYGQVVGEMFISGQAGPNGFIWDSPNGLRNIGALEEGLVSAANAINHMGQVVGNSEWSSASVQHHAFLWDEVNGMQDLGTLGYRPPLLDSSIAYDINIFGQVVGRSNASSSTEGVGGWYAFVWDRENGMQDLNDLIPKSSGWTLGTAFAINDSGWIVGYGYLEGEEGHRAFLLMPGSVEPMARFIAMPLLGIAQQIEVKFYNGSTGTVNTVEWDFGDGSFSHEWSPTHTYDTPRTYTVTLTVSGPDGSDIETKTDYITVVSVDAPDLVPLVDSFYCKDFGRSVKVKLLVENHGKDEAGAFEVAIYLSSNLTLDDNDILLDKKTVNGLKGGHSTSETLRYSSNEPLTDYHVITKVDSGGLKEWGRIPETDEDNNVRTALIP